PGGPAGDPPEWTLASDKQKNDSSEKSESASPSEEESEEATQTAGEGSEEPTEQEEASTEAAEPAGATASTYVWAGVIVFALLLLAAIPAIWRSILRSRRTKDPHDLEAVWTEVRALATDYGQSLDPSGTLRFNELILSGIATTAPDSTGAAAGTTAADESTTDQPGAGEPSPGGPSAAGSGGEEFSRKSAAEAAAGASGAVETSTSAHADDRLRRLRSPAPTGPETQGDDTALSAFIDARSEEHTSELQSRFDLVCRLLLEKKKMA